MRILLFTADFDGFLSLYREKCQKPDRFQDRLENWIDFFHKILICFLLIFYKQKEKIHKIVREIYVLYPCIRMVYRVFLYLDKKKEIVTGWIA